MGRAGRNPPRSSRHPLRFDRRRKPSVSDKSWNKLLWSAGARFNAFPRLSFYGNISTSFVVPSAKSVGGTLQEEDAYLSGKNGQLPNRDLRSETGLGSDVGVDAYPIGSLNVGLRAFLNQVNDAIVDNVVSITPSQAKSVNAGRASSRGIEVMAEQTVSSAFHWFCNLTYTRTEAPQCSRRGSGWRLHSFCARLYGEPRYHPQPAPGRDRLSLPQHDWHLLRQQLEKRTQSLWWAATAEHEDSGSPEAEIAACSQCCTRPEQHDERQVRNALAVP